VHVEPLQLAPLLCVVSHVWPHEPQLAAPDICVSQPSVSGGVVTQSAQPALQLEYVHEVPVQLAPLLCTVSQTLLQPPQVDVDMNDVSQPSALGAVVLSQSPQPAAQLLYAHVVPVQVAPMLLAVLHATPHALQFRMVLVGPHPASAPESGLAPASTPVSALFTPVSMLASTPVPAASFPASLAPPSALESMGMDES
jgi:hypothetical protein